MKTRVHIIFYLMIASWSVIRPMQHGQKDGGSSALELSHGTIVGYSKKQKELAQEIALLKTVCLDKGDYGKALKLLCYKRAQFLGHCLPGKHEVEGQECYTALCEELAQLQDFYKTQGKEKEWRTGLEEVWKNKESYEYFFIQKRDK